MTTVYEAFSTVMGQVQGIRKGDRNSQQGFNFRGIDAVLNAVGPALREHGVVIVPQARNIEAERYQTAKGGQMKNVTVEMQYTVYGPEGDSFDGSAFGEAADAGDKAVSKAQSVAYRTFLLQSLTVPTDEPDPDASSHERSSEPPFSSLPSKREKVRKIATEKQVSPAELKAQMAEVGITGKLDTGTEEQVDKVIAWLVGL